jgi:outer membrane protein assembly factor BamD
MVPIHQSMTVGTRRAAGLAVLVLACAGAAACGGGRATTPPATADADKFLFDRGQQLFNDGKWIQSREYFRQIVDNYPQSPYRPDAKLALGDAFIGEDTTESLLLAVNEFREFLTFYPTSPRADYAQYRLAVAQAGQMLAPERDQTATREAIKEFDTFLERYPNSKYLPEVQAAARDAKDRLSEASYKVGVYYYRVKWWPGAIDRFREVLKNDPEFTRRDGVYYYLAETLLRQDKKAEALPYYQRLVDEFESSEFLEQARKRIAELGGSTPGR